MPVATEDGFVGGDEFYRSLLNTVINDSSALMGDNDSRTKLFLVVSPLDPDQIEVYTATVPHVGDAGLRIEIEMLFSITKRGKADTVSVVEVRNGSSNSRYYSYDERVGIWSQVYPGRLSVTSSRE